MTSPGSTKSSPGSRPAADRYEINSRGPSRLTQQAAGGPHTGSGIRALLLPGQDGETATCAESIGFAAALRSTDRATRLM